MKKLLISLFCVFILVGCTEGTKTDIKVNEGNKEGNKKETSLNIAFNAQPPSLDPHVSGASATATIARSTFEALVSFDANNEIAPVLAESFEQSEDGKSITFQLRKGVKFHNGEEMTADDVVASMERWRSLNGKAKVYLANSEFIKEDDYTVILKMDKPLTIAKYILATIDSFAGIMPKEVIDSADLTGVTEFIGTGPFKFDEWKQDQYIKFVKNDEYQSPSNEINGLAGKKEPLVDDVYFHFVTDSSTRTVGVQTGEYDIAISVPTDNYEQMNSDDNLNIHTYPGGFTTAVFNKEQGIFTDKKRREVLNLAVNKEDVMMAAFTNKDFYTLEHGLIGKDYVGWYNDAGKDVYEQYDPEAAKKLLKETGYNGETVRILTTRDYEDQYYAAVVIQEQLEQVGMKVELLVYDWPTLMDVRDDKETYDIMVMAYSPVTDPTQFDFLDSRTNYTGWTNSSKMDELLDKLLIAGNDEEAKEIFTALQAESWDYLPVVKFGDYSRVAVTQKGISGFENIHGPVIWNVSKAD